jgi:hypothetical protein
MKKLFLVFLAFAVTVAFSAPAMATASRVMSLGGYGRYLEDDFNIFEWPATLPSYANVVWVELMLEEWGIDGEAWHDVVPAIGASYGLGEDGEFGTLAMFFYSWAPGLNPYDFWYPGWNTGDPFAYSLDNKFTVLYGYSLEGLSFGLFFARADASSVFEDGTTAEWSEAHTTIGAGVRFDAGDAAYIDVNVDISMGSYTGTDLVYGDITEDANKMFGFKARMFYEWNETITWVPYFSWRSYDFSLKADDDAFADTYWGDKGMMLDFGIGANIMVNEDNMILFAIEPYSFAKREPSEIPDGVDGDYEWKATVMPRFILGLETDVKDWLTFRMGGVHELYKEEVTPYGGDPDATQTWTGSWFGYYMGLGFHVGDFDIDCLINEETPFRLGYWLTGYEHDPGEAPIWMISTKYHF